ncbi:MAG: hypothetical protein R2940_07245 [Syntrophotaleaceae bacterium]
MKKTCGVVLSVLMLSGCVTTSERIKALEHSNTLLSQDLSTAKDNIARLNMDKNRLSEELDECRRVSRALEKEKDVRTKEAGDIRQEIRDFMKKQILALRDFTKREELLDYIGGELLQRPEISDEGLTLVDLKNPMPGPGSLVGLRGLFTSPCKVKLVILRPLNDSSFVVWESPIFQIADPGAKAFDFDSDVAVEKGDLVGYAFEGPVGVPYDRGTGKTLFSSRKLVLGDRINPESLNGVGQNRAYSVGVVGMF